MKLNLEFLIDVFWCSLSSFGGPEAHYGVFSKILVHKKRYLDETTLGEMIGVFALVPGPSSTQTITAIGYLVGGPWLAFLTFLIWAVPAIITMTLIGVFFSLFNQQPIFNDLLKVLPPIAIGFIAFAGWSLSKKMLIKLPDWGLFLLTLFLAYLLVGVSIWSIPLILLMVGGIKLLLHPPEPNAKLKAFRIPWIWLVLILLFAFIGLGLSTWIVSPWISLFNSFYRYGYSVIGGGQIVIPLMIQELVTQQSRISLETFLSGYAIDQAIPGPLFSFAAFVGAQSLSESSLSWLAGLFAGFSIFLPGILLVYFVFPIWQGLRKLNWMKVFLSGISIAASALIVFTAIQQLLTLPSSLRLYGFALATFILLLQKKIPAPVIVFGLVLIGLIF